MGLINSLLFFCVVMFVFVIAKALILQDVAACDDTVLEPQTDCWQPPPIKSPPDWTPSYDFTWSPNYLNLSSESCHVVDLLCKAAKTFTGTGKALMNVVIAFAEAAKAVVMWFVYMVTFLYYIVFMFQFVLSIYVFLMAVQFTFVPGAPWYVNIPFVLPLIAASVVLVFKFVLAIFHGDN